MTNRILFLACIATLLCGFQPDRAAAQIRDRSLPSQSYYTGFFEFYAADYSDALRHYIRGANSAFKIGPDERFMDSACYWTMIGECHYHLGNYAEALVYYEQALELLLNYASGDWQQRIDPKPASIQPSNSAVQRAGITWHQSNRGNAVARIPGSFSMQFGRLDAARALVEGGVLQTPEIRAVDHAEIMRCVALAVYRRHRIKGILTQLDPFTARLLKGVKRLPTSTPVLGKWNLMMVGLANFSAGRNEKAATQINGALRLDSGLDHQLTPLGLLALARIAWAEGEEDAAAQLAIEASHSAAVFNQFDLVEDALSLGNQIHLSRERTTYPPLAPAIAWAGRNKARMMQTTMVIHSADGLIEQNEVAAAAEILQQTRRSMSGTDLGKSTLGAKIRFLNAAITFAKSEDGYPELARALDQFSRGSKWLFQLGLVNSSLSAGSISQRQAELAYERLLIDPLAMHWQRNPIETMSYLASPHVGSMEAWFEILLARKNSERAIEVAELIRRHRFFASLPMSGRVMAIRWMLTAPEDTLTAEALQQRSDVYARFPRLRESIKRTADIENELRKLPLNPPEKTDLQRKQQDLFVDQLRHSKFQESIFTALALTRQPADFVFPPQVGFSDISKELGNRRAVLASLETPSGFHQFVLTQQTRRYLGVIRQRDLRRKAAALYKTMGITDANNAIDAETLQGHEWKPVAADLKQLIFENYHDDQWENFDELVVVPDGLLWYVPFELLQTGTDEASWKNLNESVRIRYLPMVALASHARRTPATDSRFAVVTGKIHPKVDPEFVDPAFERLTDSITNAVRYSNRVKVPSNLLTTVVDTLIVWRDTKFDPGDLPYGLMPFQLDYGRVGGTLRGWMGAPWRGPENVIMPALSSGSAAGVKNRSDGHELFLTSCGLLASGVRSALISRWRTGGENSLELTREFVIRSQQMSTPQALYESAKFARDLELDFANEIRIKPDKETEPFKAEHPFFWSGNLLIDLAGHEEQNWDADPATPPIVMDLDQGDNAPDPKMDDVDEPAEKEELQFPDLNPVPGATPDDESKDADESKSSGEQPMDLPGDDDGSSDDG